MKTDSVFYRLFKEAPGLFFELLGESSDLGQSYEFRSEELKQTAYRIDGMFFPKPGAADQTVVFAEVQFQKDPYLYDRMFSEIGLYLHKNPDILDWRAVAIFSRRSLEPQNQHRHRNFIQGDQFQVVYLEDFLDVNSDLLGIQIMQLIISKPKATEKYLQRIVNQLSEKTEPQNQAIIELLCTVMVYKFPKMSREEIESMFSVSELKQTRVYQEAKAEGVAEGATEGELKLILRMLNKKFGAVAPNTQTQIQALSLTKLEDLGEALLDFSEASDLDDWLKENQ